MRILKRIKFKFYLKMNLNSLWNKVIYQINNNNNKFKNQKVTRK